jgi:hypothetical protein
MIDWAGCTIVVIGSASPKSYLVGGKKDDSISVKARCGPAGLKNGCRRDLGGIVGFLAVSMIDAENDEPGIKVLRHVGT